jgi:DNA polymerase III delta subunit
MEVKELKQMLVQVGKLDLSDPPVLLVSGNDENVFDTILEHVERRLTAHEAVVHSFSGEPGDAERFLEEIFNIPLFSPYRLLVFRHSEDSLPSILAREAKRKGPQGDLSRRPDNTAILLQYAGVPPKGFLKSLGSNLVHYVSRDIYAEKLESTIEQLAHGAGLVLTEEALHEIKERTPPRTGALQSAMERLKDLLPAEKRKSVGLEDVREVLFPRVGWNLFRLVDSLFSGDFQAYQSEMRSYNAKTDSFLSLLSQILRRTNELRHYRLGASLSMKPGEMATFLGIQGRHEFVQKKILHAREWEKNRFSPERLDRIYGFLVDVGQSFRSNVGADHHSSFFDFHAIQIFFPERVSGSRQSVDPAKIRSDYSASPAAKQ